MAEEGVATAPPEDYDSADDYVPHLALGVATDDIDRNTWRHSTSGRGSNSYLATHSHEGPHQP